MPDGILISEEEFARVVSLKAAHDTGAERQRELAERNRALARSLDECRAEAARFEAQLQALRDDVDKAGRRARTAEELAASLQADLLAKESEVALLESNVTSLTAKLHGAEEAILQHKVYSGKDGNTSDCLPPGPGSRRHRAQATASARSEDGRPAGAATDAEAGRGFC